MNEPSLRKFAADVPKDGLILYSGEALPADFTPCAAPVLCIPAVSMSDHLGSVKAANIVMMGALLEETCCLAYATAAQLLENKIKNPALLETDLRALAAGRDFADHQATLGPVTQPDGFA